METLLQVNQKKSGMGKVMVGAGIFAILLIAGAIYLLSFQSTLEEQKEKILEGALRTGSPEFEKVTKDIIFSTDTNNTTESYTGLGRIMMIVPATISNQTDRKITLLEVNLSVVDPKNNVIKDKNVIVIPGLQVKELPSKQDIKIEQTLDGFDPKDDRAMARWRVTAIKFE